jgi:NitT/TauT family transport system substrate-binding protein
MSRKITFSSLMCALMLTFLAGSFLAAGPAEAMDKVTLRTNWLYYGSHAIFYCGKDKGFYEEEGIALDVRQGNGSGNAVRLVANKNDTFAYASSSTMLNLAAKDAPVISVATIDATGADACLCRPDSGIKEIKDLEGKQIMTTAAASVNTFFPVALANAGVDASKIEIINVAEAALVPSYLQNKAPCILGGIDDKPAEIQANGGEAPVIFNYANYGVYQPGYSIVAHKDLVKNNPDLVRRFVKATLKATAAAEANPDECIDSLVNWAGEASVEKKQARQVLDATLSILYSPNNSEKKIGLNIEKDWASAMELFKKYKDLKTDKKATDFYTNEFIE